MAKISKRDRKRLKSKLSIELVQRYGNGTYYKWRQVSRTCQELWRASDLSLAFACALYCTHDEFQMMQDSTGINESYEHLREQLGVGATNLMPASVGKVKPKAYFYESGIGMQST